MIPNSIRLIIADDHEIFRDGIITLLSKFEDMEVVAEASDGTNWCNLQKSICRMLFLPISGCPE